MKRLLILLLLIGCGSPARVVSTTFNNQTTATQAQLLELWQGAQQAIANPPNGCIPKAPVTHPKNPGCWPADPRALQVQPDGLKVRLGPPPYNSYGEFQVSGTDSPSGWVWGVAWNAYDIEVAPSMLLSPGVTGYEMQNAILERLGHDVSGR